jgi:hypothetical protein
MPRPTALADVTATSLNRPLPSGVAGSRGPNGSDVLAGARKDTSNPPGQQPQVPQQPPAPSWAADYGHLDVPQLEEEVQRLTVKRGGVQSPHAVRQHRQQWSQTWVGDYGHLDGPR